MSRATFHSRYNVPNTQAARGTKGPIHERPRLGDFIRLIVDMPESQDLMEPERGEFCVFDWQTKEQAFAMMPYGATVATITAMIESHFATKAHRVAGKTWIV